MSSTDDLAKCIAEFDLVNARPSEAWGAYFAQRQAADAHEDDVEERSEENSIYDMVNSAVDVVLMIRGTSLQETESETISDGIVILSQNVQGDGKLNVRLHPRFTAK